MSTYNYLLKCESYIIISVCKSHIILDVISKESKRKFSFPFNVATAEMSMFVCTRSNKMLGSTLASENQS